MTIDGKDPTKALEAAKTISSLLPDSLAQNTSGGQHGVQTSSNPDTVWGARAPGKHGAEGVCNRPAISLETGWARLEPRGARV